ncbi:glycosyltransferase family 4 protein [Stutzerimonas urumqiensis]|uniref:glycosyltransferase family 4 protein n=1 Tax=Stutzerimonas urumqiensis TaxID=638269 RepID=UPI0013CEA06A|nr:glycosyltransferase family 1 protein [Stutzerimonas urumqiensis]
MNLLLNTESLTPPITGVGNYTLNVLRGLRELELLDSIECFSGSSFETVEQAIDRASGTGRAEHASASIGYRLRTLIRRLPLAYRARSMLHDLQLSKEITRRREHVYHEPNFILKAHQGPSVATIHDLSFIHYPEHHPAERVAWIGSELPKTLRRADMLITPSEIVRQELIAELRVPADKVRSIHLGAADCFTPMNREETASCLARHGLAHGRYVLFVASLEPRKGIDLLLDAWCALPAAMQQEFPLVLAGAPGWKNRDLLGRLKRLQETSPLRHLHYVPFDDLPTLYAGAAAFVYPSHYEGFGLPVLEAMRCGIATITTESTSMAEFTDGNALLVERGNRDALAHALYRLLDDEPYRRTLGRQGAEHARHFSWRQCARETYQVYQAAQERHRDAH